MYMNHTCMLMVRIRVLWQQTCSPFRGRLIAVKALRLLTIVVQLSHCQSLTHPHADVKAVQWQKRRMMDVSFACG